MGAANSAALQAAWPHNRLGARWMTLRHWDSGYTPHIVSRSLLYRAQARYQGAVERKRWIEKELAQGSGEGKLQLYLLFDEAELRVSPPLPTIKI